MSSVASAALSRICPPKAVREANKLSGVNPESLAFKVMVTTFDVQMSAEREGINTLHFPNPPELQRLRRNLRLLREIRSSGWSSSFPVVAGSGGDAPGQNRDKSIPHSFPLFAGLIVALFGVLLVVSQFGFKEAEIMGIYRQTETLLDAPDSGVGQLFVGWAGWFSDASRRPVVSWVWSSIARLSRVTTRRERKTTLAV